MLIIDSEIIFIKRNTIKREQFSSKFTNNLVFYREARFFQGYQKKIQNDIKKTLKCTTSINNIVKSFFRQNIIFIARVVKVQELIK